MKGKDYQLQRKGLKKKVESARSLPKSIVHFLLSTRLDYTSQPPLLLVATAQSMDPEQSHVGTAGPGPGVGHVLSPSHPVKLGHVHNHLQVFQGAGGCGGQRKDLEGAYIFMRLWNRAACSWLMHLGLSYERSKCYLLSHYTVRSLNSNLAFCPYLIQT